MNCFWDIKPFMNWWWDSAKDPRPMSLDVYYKEQYIWVRGFLQYRTLYETGGWGIPLSVSLDGSYDKEQ